MSLLDEARKLEQAVVKRLKELEPLIREYDQVRKLGERLGVKYTPEPADESTAAQTAKPAAARARAGRERAAKTAAKPRSARSTTVRKPAGAAKSKGASAKAAPARARRAAAGRRSTGRGATRPGQRSDDVLGLVRENPGITVREIAERLGVDATGLYRVANRLTKDGRVRKDGPRLYPTESAPVAGGDTGAASTSGGQTTPPAPATETTTPGGSE
jgi:hypothetical protein